MSNEEDPEIRALHAIDKFILKPLDLPTQARLARWLTARVADDSWWAQEAEQQREVEAAISTELMVDSA